MKDTLNKATLLIENYRGALAVRDRKVLYSLAGAGAFAILLAVTVGMIVQDTDRSPWFMTAFIVVLYLLTCYGVTLYFKYQSHYAYRMS